MLRPTPLRTAFAITLAVSALVGVVLPLADAYAERAAQVVRAHVDEPGSHSGAPAHNDATCPMCRVLRMASQPAEMRAPLFVAAGVEPVASRSDHGQSARRETTSDSRAPPAPSRLAA